MLSRHGSGRVCLGTWGIPSSSGGLPPRLLLPSGRLGKSPCAGGAPNKGNADGAVGIFRKCWARVGCGPALGPTEKRPCATLARKVGRATSTSANYFWIRYRGKIVFSILVTVHELHLTRLTQIPPQIYPILIFPN